MAAWRVTKATVAAAPETPAPAAAPAPAPAKAKTPAGDLPKTTAERIAWCRRVDAK
jgi:hypothetical protein